MSLSLSKGAPGRLTVAAHFSVRNSFFRDSSASQAKACGYRKKYFKSRNSQGFTLIEILVAVAILSILLAAVYSTFFLSHKAMEGMDESMVKLQEARRALDILKRELDSAFYAADDEKSMFAITDRDIYGRQASQLEFTTFSPQRPGISKITYSVEDREGKLYLSKKLESPYRKEEAGEVDIIDDMGAFSLEAKYNGTWIKTWDAGIHKGIPEEIRMSLTITIKGRDVSLTDIAAPKIGRKI